MITTDSYLTIESEAGGLFKDRGSRFISRAYPVASPDEVKQILEELRKEYHDARHHCFAYRIGPGDGEFRTSDDGEPANSAGKPIYGQIISHNLTNVLIVVIRYFGGTLLGVGGLINAYRSATRDALQNAKIIEKTFDSVIRVTFPYPLINEVMKIIREEKGVILFQDFSDPSTIKVRIRNSVIEKISGRLTRNELVTIATEPL